MHCTEMQTRRVVILSTQILCKWHRVEDFSNVASVLLLTLIHRNATIVYFKQFLLVLDDGVADIRRENLHVF